MRPWLLIDGGNIGEVHTHDALKVLIRYDWLCFFVHHNGRSLLATP